MTRGHHAEPDRQPTDADMLAGVRSAAPADWDELRRLAEEVEQERTITGWTGDASPTLHETDPQLVEWPHPRYADTVVALEQLLYTMGAVVPFDWPEWYRGQSFTPESVAGRPVADAVRLITSVIRGERFSDGAIAACIDDGTLPAALRRLLDWHDAGAPTEEPVAEA